MCCSEYLNNVAGANTSLKNRRPTRKPKHFVSLFKVFSADKLRFQIRPIFRLENVTSNNRGRLSVRQKTFRLTKKSIIFFLFISTLTFGQNSTQDKKKDFEYEVCVYKKGKAGQILKNHQIGISDTTFAFVSGQVLEKKEPVPFVNITFTNSSGQKSGTLTDTNGRYQIHLNKGEYDITYQNLGFNDVEVKNLKLGAGQMQEIIIDVGIAPGYYNYQLSFKKPMTDKQLEKIRQKLSDE